MTETAEPTLGVPEDLADNPAFQEKLEQIYQGSRGGRRAHPRDGRRFRAAPGRERHLLHRARVHPGGVPEMVRGAAAGQPPIQRGRLPPHRGATAKRLGRYPFLKGIFDFYRDELEWPEGAGPQVWVYSGEHGYSPGIPRIYVGTHPAYDGIGINFHNGRWLHIEHIWNGDDAEFSEEMKQRQRRGAGDRLRPPQACRPGDSADVHLRRRHEQPGDAARHHVPPGRERDRRATPRNRALATRSRTTTWTLISAASRAPLASAPVPAPIRSPW